jgi:hypothetical protein
MIFLPGPWDRMPIPCQPRIAGSCPTQPRRTVFYSFRPASVRGIVTICCAAMSPVLARLRPWGRADQCPPPAFGERRGTGQALRVATYDVAPRDARKGRWHRQTDRRYLGGGSSSRRHFVKCERETRSAIAASERDVLAQLTDESFRAGHVGLRDIVGAVVQMLMRSNLPTSETFLCDHIATCHFRKFGPFDSPLAANEPDLLRTFN